MRIEEAGGGYVPPPPPPPPPPPVHHAAHAAPTPQQKTDAAARVYRSALQARAQAAPAHHAPPSMGMRTQMRNELNEAVNTAQTNYCNAVQAEQQFNVNQAKANALTQYQSLPPQARRAMLAATPPVNDNQIIQQTTAAIEARQAKEPDIGKDPRIVAETRHASHAFQVRHTADGLIQTATRDGGSAADQLKGIDLNGQPQEVIDAVNNDPRVQKWDTQATHDLATKPTVNAVKELADLAKASPQVASPVIRQLWGSQDVQAVLVTNGAATISATDPGVYKNLATIYNALDGTPGGKQVQQQIAGDIAYHQQNNPTVLQRTLNQAIGDGADPKLALATASEMAASGKHDAANKVVDGVVQGAKTLQAKADGDLKDYVGKNEELSWLIKNEGGAMTPAQLKQAIAKYKADKIKQDPNWEKNVQQAQDKVVADGKTLASTIAALQNLPPELRNDNTARAINTLRNPAGGSQNTQDVLSFAIDQNPSLMKGEQGKAIVDFFSGANLAGKGRTFFGKLVDNYVAQTLLPRVQDVDPNRPETIAQAKGSLTELEAAWKQGHWSQALGLKDADIKSVIADVEVTFPREGDTVTSVAGRLEKLNDHLSHIKGFAPTTAAGSIFRAFGFATNAVWFAGSVSSSGKPVEKTIGILASAVGMSQTAADFGASIKYFDADGSLAKWGAGTSTAGKLTSKFVAWAAVGLSADAAVRSFASGDVPEGILNTTAAGGGAIAILFADTAWGGPVGLAIGAASVLGLGMYERIQDASKYENGRTVQFLGNAGFSHDASNALAAESTDGYSPVPLLARYAALKGYHMGNVRQQAQVVRWFNSIPPEKLAGVTDHMCQAMNDLGGKATKLSNDSRLTYQHFEHSRTNDGVSSVTTNSESGMDGLLTQLGVNPLPKA